NFMTNTKHDNRLQTSFCITINFEKDSPNGSRVFRAMCELIEAFQRFDNNLLQSLETTVKPVILLENVEAGSIKTWMKQAITGVLQGADDDSLKKGEWKAVLGNYLMQAKYLALHFLENKTEITSTKEIEVLEGELVEAAERTEINKLPFYQPINKKQLVEDLANITNTTKYLTSGDNVTYDSPYGAVQVNTTFHMSPEQIEALITDTAITSTSPMMIKIKRPDFLGNSQWEFRYDGRTIAAKISDSVWLAEYQKGNIVLRPQDALVVVMETTVRFDHDREVIGTDYKILQVLQVLPKTEQTQLNFLESGNPANLQESLLKPALSTESPLISLKPKTE
ncbi:MAG: hypothetical protein FD167_5269, partial [bacterium]